MVKNNFVVHINVNFTSEVVPLLFNGSFQTGPDQIRLGLSSGIGTTPALSGPQEVFNPVLDGVTEGNPTSDLLG